MAPSEFKEVLSPEEEKMRKEENNLKITMTLRDSKEWHEVVAYGHLAGSARAHSLTATTLRGPGMVVRRPLKFFNNDKTECIIIAHLGTNLQVNFLLYITRFGCGHDGIIHGGMLATLLDEHLAYVTLPSLPNFTGFTANLNVDYRKPVYSNQWVLIRGKLTKLEGRKAYATAQLESVDGQTVYTEAKALYISPRSAGPQTNF
ncbi:HotDog domain-containing protein [Phycomyces nitens]|nr:HotDog domain-containing protein [Phycomyces nitens]